MKDTHHSEQELIRLETSYWQALKDRDYDKALELTDDPGIVTGAQGVASLDKGAMKKMMSDQEQVRWTVEDFRLSDVTARMLSDDIGGVAYKVHEDMTVDGKPLSLDAADASTWIKRNGKWVCALHTESLLGDPFGRDKSGRDKPARH